MKTYEELINSLRCCAEYPCYDCKYRGVYMDSCDGALKNEAADAIEELSSAGSIYGKSWTLGYDAGRDENMPHWIPVTERLPDNIDEEVLVCNEGYGKDGTGFATVAVYNGNGWLECWERKQYLACITHWMPLPEPPKEET